MFFTMKIIGLVPYDFNSKICFIPKNVSF